MFSPAMQSTFNLFQDRLYDLENNRSNANEIYQNLITSDFLPAAQAAKKGLKKAYQRNKKEHLISDMKYGDPVAY